MMVDGSQFPRPQMQEIGRAPDDPANLKLEPRSAVSVCKRGHSNFGHPRFCGTCGTKFFRCWNCGDAVTFEEQHACPVFLPAERFHAVRWRWRYWIKWRLIGRKGAALMVALRSLKDDDHDLGPLARDLAHAHADLLTAGIPVTVSSLLVEVGRCPSCTRPLLRGDTVAYCTDCGSEVDQ